MKRPTLDPVLKKRRHEKDGRAAEHGRAIVSRARAESEAARAAAARAARETALRTAALGERERAARVGVRAAELAWADAHRVEGERIVRDARAVERATEVQLGAAKEAEDRTRAALERAHAAERAVQARIEQLSRDERRRREEREGAEVEDVHTARRSRKGPA